MLSWFQFCGLIFESSLECLFVILQIIRKGFYQFKHVEHKGQVSISLMDFIMGYLHCGF